jgi:hypothetical protein
MLLGCESLSGRHSCLPDAAQPDSNVWPANRLVYAQINEVIIEYVRDHYFS